MESINARHDIESKILRELSPEHDIFALMGSRAYCIAWHPDHNRIHELVTTSWFATQYGNSPLETDVTGRMVTPRAASDFRHLILAIHQFEGRLLTRGIGM